jgi:hypothetical protein
VVVVVSEERGVVSLCFNGNVVRNLTSESLREAILGLFYRRKKRSKQKAGAEATGRIKTERALAGAAEATGRVKTEREPTGPALPRPDGVEEAR